MSLELPRNFSRRREIHLCGSMDVDKKKPWCRGRGAMSPPPPGKKKTEDEERGAMSLSIFYCLAFNMNGEKEILVWQLCVFCFNYIF